MDKAPALKYGFSYEQMLKEGTTTEEDIHLIKTWISTQNLPELINEQIILFLLSCSNDHDLTKSTIKAYYAVKNGAPQLFNNRKIERKDLQKQLRTGNFSVFPKRTDDGCVIIFFSFRDTSYWNFEYRQFMTLLFMTLDAAIYDYPPKGLIMLYDMKGLSFMHLTKLRLGIIRTYFQYLQEGLPVKLKNIHILNSVSFVNTILSLIKPFAKAEVLNSIYFHPQNLDMEGFYKTWIPKDCLPCDYGGDLPSVNVLHQENIQKLTDLQSHFDAEEMQRRSI